MLTVANKPFKLNVIMLSVVMLNVAAPTHKADKVVKLNGTRL
jgi:hypothetical protein